MPTNTTQYGPVAAIKVRIGKANPHVLTSDMDELAEAARREGVEQERKRLRKSVDGLASYFSDKIAGRDRRIVSRADVLALLSSDTMIESTREVLKG